MGNFFHQGFYRPIFNALIFFYTHFSFGDLGVAIILLTIFIRLVLFPLFYKGARDQAIIQRLAPKIKEIQTTHKNDREAHGRALMALYKEHKINPMSGFLLLLVQLPVLIALYQVFLSGLKTATWGDLYSFVGQPAFLNHSFLQFLDLSKPSIPIVILSAVGQFFQGKLALAGNANGRKKEDLSAPERAARQMIYFGPAITLVILFYLPAAIGLYWLTTSVFSVIQQIVINKRVPKYLAEVDKQKNGNGGITS